MYYPDLCDGSASRRSHARSAYAMRKRSPLTLRRVEARPTHRHFIVSRWPRRHVLASLALVQAPVEVGQGSISTGCRRRGPIRESPRRNQNPPSTPSRCRSAGPPRNLMQLYCFFCSMHVFQLRSGPDTPSAEGVRAYRAQLIPSGLCGARDRSSGRALPPHPSVGGSGLRQGGRKCFLALGPAPESACLTAELAQSPSQRSMATGQAPSFRARRRP